MKKGGTGGARTLTGLNFEKKVDLYKILSKIPGYRVERSRIRAGVDVYFKGELVARCFRKYEFYKFFSHIKINFKLKI